MTSNAETSQSFFPERQTAGRYGIPHFGGHTGSLPAFGNSLPRKESKDRSRRSCFVAEVEVIGTGIIKVDGLLNESQSQDFRVESQVTFRVASDCRDVVKSLYTVVHKTVALPAGFIYG